MFTHFNDTARSPSASSLRFLPLFSGMYNSNKSDFEEGKKRFPPAAGSALENEHRAVSSLANLCRKRASGLALFPSFSFTLSCLSLLEPSPRAVFLCRVALFRVQRSSLSLLDRAQRERKRREL